MLKSLKIFGLELSIYKWHSINIIPHFTCIKIVSDNYDDCSSIYKIIGSAITLTIFGIIFNIFVPFELPCIAVCLPSINWSRRRKKLYFTKHNLCFRR